MATWHQRRGMKRTGYDLRHATLWTVYHDPMNEPASAMLFATEDAAETYMAAREAAGAKSLSILPPRNKGE